MFRSGDFSGDEVRKGIDLFIALRDAGIFVESVEGLTADTMMAQFFAEDAAIMPSGSWAFEGTPEDLIEWWRSGIPEPLRRGVDSQLRTPGTELGVVLSLTLSTVSTLRTASSLSCTARRRPPSCDQGLVMALNDVPTTRDAEPLLVSSPRPR